MTYSSRKHLKNKILSLGVLTTILLVSLVVMLFKYGVLEEIKQSFSLKDTTYLEEVNSYKDELISDLNDNVNVYENLINENNELKEQLAVERDSVKALLFKVENLNNQVIELSELKEEFLKIKEQVSKLNDKQSNFVKVSEQKKMNESDRLNKYNNTKDVQDNSGISNKISNRAVESLISDDSNKIKSNSSKEVSYKLPLSNFKIITYRTTSNRRLIVTNTASKISTFELWFDIPENVNIKEKSLKYYIQLFDTQNNPVGVNNNVFVSGKSLEFNFEMNVNYYNEEQTAKELFAIGYDSQPLKSGTYFINIFDSRGELMLTKSILLN